MDKHTQTIRRQIFDELFDCVWPFCEIGAKRVNLPFLTIRIGNFDGKYIINPFGAVFRIENIRLFCILGRR